MSECSPPWGQNTLMLLSSVPEGHLWGVLKIVSWLCCSSSTGVSKIFLLMCWFRSRKENLIILCKKFQLARGMGDGVCLCAHTFVFIFGPYPRATSLLMSMMCMFCCFSNGHSPTSPLMETTAWTVVERPANQLDTAHRTLQWKEKVEIGRFKIWMKDCRGKVRS